MKPQDFFELTRQTRAAQKAWFRGKRLSDLDESMRLEKLLDAALEEGLDPEAPQIKCRHGATATQLDLFQEEP